MTFSSLRNGQVGFQVWLTLSLLPWSTASFSGLYMNSQEIVLWKTKSKGHVGEDWVMQKAPWLFPSALGPPISVLQCKETGHAWERLPYFTKPSSGPAASAEGCGHQSVLLWTGKPHTLPWHRASDHLTCISNDINVWSQGQHTLYRSIRNSKCPMCEY